jgi:hypothetical protein
MPKPAIFAGFCTDFSEFIGVTSMSDNSTPHPATSDELAEALSFALRFNGRKSFPQSNALMARITAEHLVRHLARCGFEVTRRVTSASPSTSGHSHPLSNKPPE